MDRSGEPLLDLHQHRWQAVTVVVSTGPINDRSRTLDGRRGDRYSPPEGYWVAQSCECGAVRAVPLEAER